MWYFEWLLTIKDIQIHNFIYKCLFFCWPCWDDKLKSIHIINTYNQYIYSWFYWIKTVAHLTITAHHRQCYPIILNTHYTLQSNITYCLGLPHLLQAFFLLPLPWSSSFFFYCRFLIGLCPCLVNLEFLPVSHTALCVSRDGFRGNIFVVCGVPQI